MGWIDECRRHCKSIKYLSTHLSWSQSPQHSRTIVANSTLLDDTFVAIPGLYFNGAYRSGAKHNYQSYGVMYKHGQHSRRVFMIEVFPNDYPSHREPDGTQFFGPHMHLGDTRLEIISKEIVQRIDPEEISQWIAKFRRHTKIDERERGMFKPPFDADLFG